MAEKKKKKRVGWLTTDEYEIDLRRKRADEEPMKVSPVGKGRCKVFQDYLVERTGIDNPMAYKVEFRSFRDLINTCSCPDFRKNFLGNCKHIEKVSAKLEAHVNSQSPYVEIFISRNSLRPDIMLPSGLNNETARFIGKYLDAARKIKQPEADTLQVIMRDMKSASPKISENIRISFEIPEYILDRREKERVEDLRKNYGEKLRESAGNAEFLRHPLYDYQIDGMLHLAFTGRAMLADEMGLGKTVQAVAAAAVMREYFGVKRVLLVAPASLKTEWEEQIEKFTALSSEMLFGLRKQRLERYKNSNAFFLLTNYEQVIRDYNEINSNFQPDPVILDEAQRIKNWRTKTATHLKRLQSRFAFVLTGTPIENKIDELYSLVDFIDPSIFGSLFRFNRKFYNFDEDGKAIGCRNLRELHEATSHVMLRRRKDEISEQLPDRIDNNYFVDMTAEQLNRYAEYESIVARLFHKAKSRNLLPAEFERLQRALSCMRILCDSVYIMDQKVKESPKVEELMNILDDVWEDDPDRKIIIFSEWVKMLELVRKRLDEDNIDTALHVGYVNQVKRREEINRFKKDKSCKIFLSSDSGGLGLNLQTASVVINLDLPWNPAKLEQRIARAWRKHQKNTVSVINLISRGTIEHKMLATLQFKQGLADVVLDARGDFEDFEKPNAKAAFMERLSSIMGDNVCPEKQETDVPPREQLAQELQVDNPGLGVCQAIYDQDNGVLQTVFAVGNTDSQEKLNEKIEKTHGLRLPEEKLVVITQENQALLRQLAALGIISINESKMENIFEAENFAPPRPSENKQRLKMSRTSLSKAERNLKMADALKSGGFDAEAVEPARQGVVSAGLALYALAAKIIPETAPEKFTDEMMTELKNKIDFERKHLMFLQLCAHDLADDSSSFNQDAETFVEAATEYIGKFALKP